MLVPDDGRYRHAPLRADSDLQWCPRAPLVTRPWSNRHQFVVTTRLRGGANLVSVAGSRGHDGPEITRVRTWLTDRHSALDLLTIDGHQGSTDLGAT